MKEVNHRFKNNLASLIGILQMAEDRAQTLGPDYYPLLLQSLAGRIRGLATVHNMLTQSKWRPLQLKSLCEGIIKSSLQGMEPDEPAAAAVSSPDIKVNSTHAHNLGLVINELAANSIKYAFPHRDANRIDVDIKQDDGVISIVFKDNGPGYPEDIINGDYRNASIGLELIAGIVQHNLDGAVRFANENGAATYIQFENPPGSNAFGDQNPF
jgi:two-component sensor histidine kinase